MKDHLILLYQDAIASMNVRNFEQARKLLNTIVIEQPNFEHGGAFYDLGCCLEELKEYGSARRAFEKALSHEPTNPIYLGGLASFLYLWGDPKEAFEKHLSLVRLEQSQGDVEGIKQTAISLQALGKKIGLTSEAIDKLIEDARYS